MILPQKNQTNKYFLTVYENFCKDSLIELPSRAYDFSTGMFKWLAKKLFTCAMVLCFHLSDYFSDEWQIFAFSSA